MIANYMAIHAPYAEMIMSGRKDVETRLRRISDKFIGQRVGIYEPERKILIGSVLILGQKIYPTAAAFRKDYSRHLVKRGSQYDIKKGGRKIGIIVGKPSRDIFGQRPKKFAPSTIVKNNPASPIISKALRSAFMARYETSSDEDNEMGRVIKKIGNGSEFSDLTDENKSAFLMLIKDDLAQYGGLNQELQEALEIAGDSAYPKRDRFVYRSDANRIKKYQAEAKKFLASLPPTQNPVPPAAVARAAKRGLEARKKYKRGGTAVGVARARDLSRRANVSMRTIARMSSYFARHRASRYESAKRISDPTSAARIADDLWGGTAGMRWAKKMTRRE